MVMPGIVKLINAPGLKNPNSLAVRTCVLDIDASPERPGVAGDKKVNGAADAHPNPDPDKETTNVLAGSTALAGKREIVIVTPCAEEAVELREITGLSAPIDASVIGE